MQQGPCTSAQIWGEGVGWAPLDRRPGSSQSWHESCTSALLPDPEVLQSCSVTANCCPGHCTSTSPPGTGFGPTADESRALVSSQGPWEKIDCESSLIMDSIQALKSSLISWNLNEILKVSGSHSGEKNLWVFEIPTDCQRF